MERGPNGRPMVKTGGGIASSCIVSAQLLQPTPTEARGLAALTSLTDRCLGKRVSPYVTILPSFEVAQLRAPLPRGVDWNKILTCVQTARRQQLASYVAPPALLFVTDASNHLTSQPRNAATAKW